MSQRIRSPQKCRHPHTFLRFQVRNIQQKWQRIEEAQYVHSLPEGPRLRRLLANQHNKGSLQKARLCFVQKSLVDLITVDHKVVNEGCESRDNHRYAVVVRRTNCQNSSNRRTDRKLNTQTTRWNLDEHVRFNHGITALQHLIDPRQMA